MANKVTLGDILKEARARRGMSIAKAAKALETTRTTYRAWEQLNQEPGLVRVPALSDFAEKPEDDIVAAIRASIEARGLYLSSPVLTAA